MLCSYKHDNFNVATHRHESLTQFTDTRAGPPRPPATWPRCTTPWPAWPASASGTWPRRPTMKRYFLFSWWLFQVFSNNSYQKQISFDVNRIFARCNYKLERLEIQKFSFEIFSCNLAQKPQNKYPSLGGHGIDKQLQKKYCNGAKTLW